MFKSVWERIHLKKSEALGSVGKQLFRRGEEALALEYAQKLIGKGYSGGRELKALVQSSRGEFPVAHDTLLDHVHLQRARGGGTREARLSADRFHARLLVWTSLFA